MTRGSISLKVRQRKNLWAYRAREKRRARVSWDPEGRRKLFIIKTIKLDERKDIAIMASQVLGDGVCWVG